MLKIYIFVYEFENYKLKITSASPRAQWVKNGVKHTCAIGGGL